MAGTLKTLTADYSVSGVEAAGGGNIVLKTAPTLGQLVVIERDVPLTQTTVYPAGGAFPATSHEKALDKLTMIVQALKGIASRSWRFAASSSFAGAGWEVDEPKGGLYPRIKADCTGIEYVDLQSCGTYANPVTTRGDLVRGNDCGAQERLAVGTVGYVLTSMPATGKPDYAAGGSVLLTNKADTRADAGRIFALDNTCDSAFVSHTPNTVGLKACTRFAVVTATATGDDCQGMVVLAGGPITALAQGAIARGEYLKWGTTFGAVQTTCVHHHQYRPIPHGAVGIATGHSSGGCVPMLKFDRPSSGMQGFSAVRRNRSASNTGTSSAVLTDVDMIADGLVLADACNDIVVVKFPASVTNCGALDGVNKLNSRDLGASPGNQDVHYYFVYNADCALVGSRHSIKGPDTSGPELPTCETHWAYSHSLYWNGTCLRRHTVRGAWVSFDCVDSTRVLNGGTATCETRVSLVEAVPYVAQRVRLSVALRADGGNLGEALIGYRLNCITHTIGVSATSCNMFEVIIPNNNQEFFYRLSVVTGDPSLDVRVLGFSVPNGDAS